MRFFRVVLVKNDPSFPVHLCSDWGLEFLATAGRDVHGCSVEFPFTEVLVFFQSKVHAPLVFRINNVIISGAFVKILMTAGPCNVSISCALRITVDYQIPRLVGSSLFTDLFVGRFPVQPAFQFTLLPRGNRRRVIKQIALGDENEITISAADLITFAGQSGWSNHECHASNVMGDRIVNLDFLLHDLLDSAHESKTEIQFRLGVLWTHLAQLRSEFDLPTVCRGKVLCIYDRYVPGGN